MSKTKEEEIRPIPSHPRYSIDIYGNVYGIRVIKIKPSYDKPGYERVCLSLGGNKAKTIKVHRLVAETFLLNPNNLSDVNHKDGNKTNNNLSNLEWVSRSCNIKHAFRIGLKTISDEQKDRFIKMAKSRTGVNNCRSKKIVNTENGVIYHSVNEASIRNGIKRTTLSGMLTGRNRNKTKLRYYEK